MKSLGTDVPATRHSLYGVVRTLLARARALGAADRDLTATAVVVEAQYNQSHAGSA